MSLVAGISMLAIATVVPVMAQTSDTANVNVDVQDFFTIDLATDADGVGADGGSPCAGSAANAEDLTPAISGIVSITCSAEVDLLVDSNSNGGFQVTNYFDDNAGARLGVLVISGGTETVAADVIADSGTVIPDSQAANQDITSSTATGVNITVVEANTTAAMYGADEVTQWGAQAGGATLASNDTLYGEPIGNSIAAAGRVISDTDTLQTSQMSVNVQVVVGAADDQRTGVYSGVLIFSGSVL